ncbi:hypothetical protein [Kaistia nematophila]|uniref:Uncharacterized protein n=1 Tax=Kaistia nematophila TaxID=2994654 RepID=A0A9X3E2V8_9HYPH|nr:hypothetical protein [Kaistia nematophila]MCX5569647.1 hypothetical protein [Kaistia nematophila]
MCNACGFLCCAWDLFSGCGCDWCDEPDCRAEEEFDDDDDGYECRHIAPRVFICDAPALEQEGR